MGNCIIYSGSGKVFKLLINITDFSIFIYETLKFFQFFWHLLWSFKLFQTQGTESLLEGLIISYWKIFLAME